MSEQELIWSAVVAWMSSRAIEIGKNISWLPLKPYASAWNAWASRFIAAVAALGIHSSFDGATGTLTITGLTLIGVFHSVGEYAKQKMLQEVAYRFFTNKEENGGILR